MFISFCAYRKSYLGQEAASAYRLQIKMFGLSSPGTIEKYEKSTLRFANKGACRVGKRELEHLSPGLELRRGPLRLGCAALVAVMKSANLRYGNDGSECRRLHGPGFRCVLG